jgi:hypothetical protein
MKNKFYMVYVDNSNSPTYKHESIESAETEARRLSKELNRKAYVLATTKSFEFDSFKVENCIPEDSDLPF